MNGRTPPLRSRDSDRLAELYPTRLFPLPVLVPGMARLVLRHRQPELYRVFSEAMRHLVDEGLERVGRVR
jgi:hypothetical protein